MSEFRTAYIYVSDRFAGTLSEYDGGYLFQYNAEYLSQDSPEPVSLTMPLTAEPYRSSSLFPFFDGLIPEGWLLDVVSRNWKIDRNDRFGLLLTACRDGIGNVTVLENRE